MTASALSDIIRLRLSKHMELVMRKFGPFVAFLIIYPMLGYLVGMGGILACELGSWFFDYSFELMGTVSTVMSYPLIYAYFTAMGLGYICWYIALNLIVGVADEMIDNTLDHHPDDEIRPESKPDKREGW